MKTLLGCAALAMGLLLVGCGNSKTDPLEVSDQPAVAFRRAEVDRADPAATAKAILAAYKAKDLSALSKLATATNAEMMTKIAKVGESHSRYKSVFGGWRWGAVSGWDGQVGEVRYRGAETAMVRFGKFDTGEIAVVTLVFEGDRWCFDDVNRHAQSRFESLPIGRRLGEVPKADEVAAPVRNPPDK